MKYQLIMTRDITESAIVTIEADTVEKAKQEAYENRYDLHWETDDFCNGETYCTDVKILKTKEHRQECACNGMYKSYSGVRYHQIEYCKPYRR